MLPVQRAKKDGPSPYCKKQQSEAQRFMEVKRIQIVPKNNRYQVQQCSRYRQNLQGNHICHKITDILLQMPVVWLLHFFNNLIVNINVDDVLITSHHSTEALLRSDIRMIGPVVLLVPIFSELYHIMD